MNYARKWLLIIVSIIGLSGAMMLTESFYIPAKAVVAQLLIKSSYYKTEKNGGKHFAPWPWADTFPIARLVFNNTELFVLEGTNLRNLAFGPTRVENSNEIDALGTKIILGHRDTHFKGLAELTTGSELTLETPSVGRQVYIVRDIVIVDYASSQIPVNHNTDQLVLVTCYPFDSTEADPTLRYIVRADLKAS